MIHISKDINWRIDISVKKKYLYYNKLFMLAGKDVKVTIRCKKRVLDAMIDLFGRSIMLRDFDADHIAE